MWYRARPSASATGSGDLLHPHHCPRPPPRAAPAPALARPRPRPRPGPCRRPRPGLSLGRGPGTRSVPRGPGPSAQARRRPASASSLPLRVSSAGGSAASRAQTRRALLLDHPAGPPLFALFFSVATRTVACWRHGVALCFEDFRAVGYAFCRSSARGVVEVA